MQEQTIRQSSFTAQVCDRDAKNMEITGWVKKKPPDGSLQLLFTLTQP